MNPCFRLLVAGVGVGCGRFLDSQMYGKDTGRGSGCLGNCTTTCLDLDTLDPVILTFLSTGLGIGEASSTTEFHLDS